MKKLLLSLALFAGFAANAQSSSPDVIASGGGFATGSGFTNSFTIGQGSLPETFNTGTFILTQGFQQPQDLSTGLVPTLNGHGITIGTFPNPSNGEFFIEYDLDAIAEVTVEAYDVLGQLVLTETSSRTPGHQLHPVNLGDQPDGVYFIRCTIKAPTGTTTKTSKVTLTR